MPYYRHDGRENYNLELEISIMNEQYQAMKRGEEALKQYHFDECAQVIAAEGLEVSGELEGLGADSAARQNTNEPCSCGQCIQCSPSILDHIFDIGPITEVANG